MGSSLWELVDRYDAGIAVVRRQIVALVYRDGPSDLLECYRRVHDDLVACRNDAAAACEKLEGPRAA